MLEGRGGPEETQGEVVWAPGAPEEVARPGKDICEDRQQRRSPERHRHIPALIDTSSLQGEGGYGVYEGNRCSL